MFVLRHFDSLDRAVQILKNGGIVCYPTETFYALGVDPWNEEARNKLYQLKGRTAEKELPLIAADENMVEEFFETADPRYVLLVSRFWPGPLTLVLLSRMKGGPDKMAVRVSSHPVARKLSAEFGKPIVSTSANPGGKPPVITPEEVLNYFPSGIDVLVDDGKTPGGLPSTILSLVETPARLLREGAVAARDIFDLI